MTIPTDRGPVREADAPAWRPEPLPSVLPQGTATAPFVTWLAVAAVVIACRLIGRPYYFSQSIPLLIAQPVLWVLTAPAVIWWTGRVEGLRPVLQAAAHLAGVTFVSSVHVALVRAVFDATELRYFAIDGVASMLMGALIYATVAGPALLVRSRRKLEEEEIRRAELERNVETSRERALRSRIPESFVRNVFDTISELATSRRAAATSLLQSFAAYLRTLLEAMRSERWELQRELGLLAHHAAVLSAFPRARGRVETLTFEVPAELETASVRPGDLLGPVARVIQSHGAASEVRLAASQHDRAVLDVALTIDERRVWDESVPLPPPPAQWTGGEEPHGSRPLRVPPLAVYVAIVLAAMALVVAFGTVQYGKRGGDVTAEVVTFFTLHNAIALIFAVLPLPILVRIRSQWAQLSAVLAASVVSSVAGGYIYLHVLSSFTPGIPDLRTFNGFRMVTGNVAPKTVLCVAVLILIMSVATTRRHAAALIARADAERQVAAARLALLRSQLHPHFLFNALNSVGTLLQVDPRAAREMLARIRAFYARAEELEERAWIGLDEEIAIVREYLGIEGVRFGSRLTAAVRIAPDAAAATVPALLLQPLVENAVKHGIARHGGPGFVTVSAQTSSDRLELLVENSFRLGGRGDANGAHAGLDITSDRLRALFGNAFGLQVALEDGRAQVSVSIPLQIETGGAASKLSPALAVTYV